jgi:hypothetical protein
MMSAHRPHVVILDADTSGLGAEPTCQLFRQRAQQENAALVILGRARGLRESLPPNQVVAKPYHYAPLIRTIEQLLQR